ncbi:hypothetical protein AK812_SmicGene40122 [Symbiodinium microadriaticum]|uniref:Uncharacterized protein n=1 Tax=Symbiodinium microadriaticum TaxID=2951 RepID=A0A1Q9C9H0_SYMMI|nr:hypothetical protein AK812_SmicGene40122 [Symbiodinium microadriaticum]
MAAMGTIPEGRHLGNTPAPEEAFLQASAMKAAVMSVGVYCNRKQKERKKRDEKSSAFLVSISSDDEQYFATRLTVQPTQMRMGCMLGDPDLLTWQAPTEAPGRVSCQNGEGGDPANSLAEGDPAKTGLSWLPALALPWQRYRISVETTCVGWDSRSEYWKWVDGLDTQTPKAREEEEEEEE